MNALFQQVAPIFEDALAAGLRARVKVTGASMVPFVRSGDVVEFAVPRAGMPCPGEIVLVNRADGTYVLHRVSRVSPSGFYLRGDAQVLEEGPLSREQVVGRVAVILRHGRLIRVDRGPQRWAARVWQVTLPVRTFLLRAARVAKLLSFPRGAG